MTEILIDTMDKINDKSLTLGLLHKENFDQDTPLHLLAESDQQLDIDNNLVKLMQNLANKKILTECLKKENAEKETPLHVAARKGFKDLIEVINEIGKLVDQDSSNSDMKDQILYLLKKIDEDGNTALHLSTQKESLDLIKTETVSLILDILGPDCQKDEILKKNKFDKTPLSEAAKAGDLESLKKLIGYLEKGSNNGGKWRTLKIL